MAFIGEHWCLWLVLAIIFIGLITLNWVGRMKQMTRATGLGYTTKFESFRSGLEIFMIIIFGMIASVSSLLLMISIVVNLITHAKSQ